MKRLYFYAVGALFSGFLTCSVVSCEGLWGTPMSGTGEDCRFVPTIQDCEVAAQQITETCLRDCVVNLCTNAKVVCTEEATAEECAKIDKFGNKKGDLLSAVSRDKPAWIR